MTAFARFKEAIILIVKPLIKESTLQCTVKSVNQTDKTITCYSERDKVDYFNVRLMSLSGDQKGDGITAFPKVGSTVIICMIEGVDTMYYVSCYGEIDSYEIKIGTIKFYMDKDVIKFNDGALGGIISKQPLINNLNSIKTFVTTMKTAISSGINAVGAGTAANGATGAAAFDAAMAGSIINFEDMEDTKVKH